MPKGKGKRAQYDDDALLTDLQKRVKESGDALKDLQTRQQHQQPLTERTTFANYVRGSLVTMSTRKFKKARSAMNRILSQLMEEDNDTNDTPDVPSADPFMRGGPVMPQVRPSSNGSYSSSSYASRSPSPSEAYQPLPHAWRHQSPAATVWGSQTQEYVDQYMPQPLQQQQQQYHHLISRPQQQQQRMPPPPPPPPSQQQQQQQQQTATSVSTALGTADQALNQSPNTLDSSMMNMSGLSKLSMGMDLSADQ